ncbi:vomeronasal type-2 receptor 26-like [Gastrophryne carolinensis]
MVQAGMTSETKVKERGALLKTLCKTIPKCSRQSFIMKHLTEDVHHRPQISGEPSLQHYYHYLAVIFAIEEINQNEKLLPNLTLGYQIYESCSHESRAVANTLSILSGNRYFVPNYSCNDDGKLIGFIGHIFSSLSYVMSEMIGMYGFPQISYGVQDPIFSNRQRYPTFYRTSISDREFFKAIVDLLKQFGWTWVGILGSQDESNQRACISLMNEIIKNGGCIDFFSLFSQTNAHTFTVAVKAVETSSANVVIAYGIPTALLHMAFSFYYAPKMKKTWIIVSSMNGLVFNVLDVRSDLFNASLQLLAHQEVIPGLKSFWYDASPLTMPNDDFTSVLWYSIFRCTTAKDLHIDHSVRLCNCNDTMRVFDNFYDVDRFQDTYSVYVAVYALANALHQMLHDTGKISTQSPSVKFNFWKLNYYLRKINFKTALEDNFHFNKDGEIPGYLDIQNLFVSSDGKKTINIVDMDNCISCPEDQWTNDKRDKCVMRSIDFLSYEEPLGLALTLTAIALSTIASAILGIFIRHRKSAIVRANNMDFSITLLVSLVLSPLCILFFIGKPVKTTCLVRQVALSIIFAICISSVLGKTLTVVIAFNATKPGSTLNRFVGSKFPKYIVCPCLLIEIVICSAWILYLPPFPDYDSRSQSSLLILQCNEGSNVAFYLATGYNTLLASVCFIIAYLARGLPDNFNEAKHITFSMLVFCSVWIFFIPTYLSTKGKYMVVVEIFAILASSSVLLGCIFIPKCYIIVFRPDLNNKRLLLS